jgi:hypothetical protein
LYGSQDSLFSFKAPKDWKLVQDTGSVIFIPPSGTEELALLYTLKDKTPVGFSGTAAGDLAEAGKINFMGKQIPKVKQSYKNLTTEIYYGGQPGPANIVNINDFNFLITLKSGEGATAGISSQTEAVADEILKNFVRADIGG